MLSKLPFRAAAALVFCILFITGCTGSKMTLVEGKVNVVASFYPLYDFTQKIGGEHVNVINLVPAGVEPHDWSPKSRDMKNMTQADMFVYLGAGFEGWVHDFLESMKPEAKANVLVASEGITLLQAEEAGADAHSKDNKGHNHDEHESEWDPHVWVSPVNAKQLALNIKNKLVAIDSAHKADYEANYNKLADRLDQLHNSYKQSLDPLPNKKIVVAHDSFAYLSKEYGLTQLPIMGLSPDAEPTAQTMKDINAFIKANKLKYIFFEELVSDKVAKTLAKDAGIETLVLNPVEGLTPDQMKAGLDYASIMEANLKNLIKALQ